MTALRQVLAGEIYVGTKTATKILGNSSQASQGGSGVERLTDRELEVFEKIGRGRTTREISIQLGVGAADVEIAGTIWSYASLKETARRQRVRIDWWGNMTFAVGLTALLAAITYGIQPYGGRTEGWTNPLVLAGLIGGALLLVAFVIVETQGRGADVPPRAVPDPGVRGRQRRRAAVVDRPWRDAVHADHLAAGDLAAAARVRLRAHAAVGRHLPAAAHRGLPRCRAAVRATVRPARRPAAWPPVGCCSSRRRSSGCCCSRSTFPTGRSRR